MKLSQNWNCMDILESRKNCELELSEMKCKACKFETHSEGLLRQHKRTTHRIKETNQNIILGFKNDMFYHLKILEALGELNKIFKFNPLALRCSQF